MGVTVATTRVAANTSTGTQDITTTDLGGLTPAAALFYVGFGVTDGTAADDAQLSVGAATGASNEWCVNANIEHGQTTTDSHSETNSDRVIVINTAGTNAPDGEAEFSAWITDGVRINWTDAPTAAYLVTVVLFAGTDLSAYASNADVGNTVDLLTDVTGVGFEPDLVITALSGSVGAEDFNAVHGNISVGAVHNGASVTQRALAMIDRSAQSTAQAAMRIDNGYGALSELWIGLDYGLEFSAFDSDGFSVTTRNNGGNNAHLMYLALNFNSAVSSYVGSYTTPTATGNDAETGPGFTPQFVMLGMTMAEAEDTSYTSGLAGTIGVGVFDADDEYATSMSNEDNVSTTNTQSLSDNTAVQLPDDDGGAGLTASFVSFDANGFTLNYSAVEASAKQFWCLAIEEETAAGRTTYNTDPYGLGIGRGLSRTYKQPGKGITA